MSLRPRGIQPRAIAVCAALALAVAATAPPAAAAGTVVVSAGRFDFAEPASNADEIGVEYRWEPLRFWGLQPMAGVSANDDHAYWGYGGLGRDFFVGRRWVVRPFTGIALYERGDGKDLGEVFEFRSGLELAYRPSERTRVGLSFYHISNAGFSGTNPGEESLLLVFGFRP